MSEQPSAKVLAARARSKAWYAANHERALAVRAAYREAHRGEWAAYFREYRAKNASKKRDYASAYYAANREAMLAEGRRRYQLNKESYIARAAAWAIAHPEEAKEHTTRKNHRRRNAELSDEARAYIRVLRCDPCVYCGGVADEIDHITALGRGGDGAADNLTAACRRCNAAKGGKSLLMFLWDRRAA